MSPNRIPDLVPISTIRQRQNEILANLAHGPIVLTQRGHAAAILVGPDQWNQIVEELESLRDSLDVMALRERIAAGEEEVFDWQAVRAELLNDLEGGDELPD